MTDLRPLQSLRLSALPGVRHGFFTRRGGVSQGIYDSLNCGPGSGDDPAHVAENRSRVAAAFEVEPDRLLTAWQVHSAQALTVTAPWPGERPQGDAVIAARPGLVCGSLSADCAPVLLADAEARVVAAAHAGWKGALAGVVEATVAAMVAQGARPERIVATVGPCIGPNSYEVGLEFLERFVADDGAAATRFFGSAATAEKRYFDLPAYVLERLGRSGVREADWIGADTLADESLFFSNRRATHRADGDYGRLLSAIALA